VLQLITQGAASAVSMQGSEARPANSSAEQADTAPAAQVVAELFASELDSVGEQQAALLEALEVASELPAEALVLPDSPAQAAPELDAEQWLLSMLGQREVQLQARDAQPSAPQTAVPATAKAAGQVAASAQALDAEVSTPNNSGQLADARTPFNDKAVAQLSSQAGVPESARLPAALVKTEVLVATAVKPADAQLLAALEPLASATGAAPAPAEAVDGLAPASASTQQSTPAAAVERAIKLQGPEAKWGEQMLHALRDNVELQVQQRVQSTTIRLDPPELGSLEIFLSHESGRLNVQITASQADVARLLQSTSERLRQELVGQNFMHVNVGVATDSQSGQQHARQGRAGFFAEAEVAANQAADVAAEEKTGLNRDVLITV
jgi:flagellar hook-length control protein FliK